MASRKSEVLLFKIADVNYSINEKKRSEKKGKILIYSRGFAYYRVFCGC